MFGQYLTKICNRRNYVQRGSLEKFNYCLLVHFFLCVSGISTGALSMSAALINKPSVSPLDKVKKIHFLWAFFNWLVLQHQAVVIYWISLYLFIWSPAFFSSLFSGLYVGSETLHPPKKLKQPKLETMIRGDKYFPVFHKYREIFLRSSTRYEFKPCCGWGEGANLKRDD